MARYLFQLTAVTPPGSYVRLDSASGSTSPTAVSPVDSAYVVPGAVIRSDASTGALPRVAAGVATLYQKTLSASGAVTATATLTGTLVDGPGPGALEALTFPVPVNTDPAGLAASASNAAFSGTYARHKGNRVTAIGDSLTAGTPTAANTVTNLLGESYFTYAVLASGGQIMPLRNAGVGGETSTQILTRLAGEVAYAPDYVLICAGANDIITGTPTATLRANVASFVAQCKAGGATPILLTLPPNSSSTYKTAYAQHNAWLRAWTARNGVGLIDITSPVIDITNGSWGSGNDKGDGTHPTPAAMKLMGDAVATALKKWLPPHPTGFSPYGGDPANLLANGLFLAGTTVPTSWSQLQTSASFTVNSLATDNAIGAGNVASITVNDSGFVQLSQQINIGSGISIGDRLAFSVATSTDGAVVEPYLFMTGASAGTRNICTVSATSTGTAYGEFVVPTGTTNVLTRLKVTGIGSAKTGKFAQPTLVNLTTLDATLT